MISTTLEQSRKLVELGIDPSTADMHYAFSAMGGSAFQDMIDRSATLLPGQRNTKFPYEPAWSLSALIDLLPSQISDGDWKNKHLNIDKTGIYYTPINSDEEPLIVELYNKYTGENEGINTLIDACVEMIVKLKENKII